ncbi:hypothetical protein LZC95_43485 [Pendulispora brunnea]|uniref:Secreted protein n=1 Tax=Pendulispora brunnea TaxID=2905690 RepID=A0ABZ2K5F6_9BACT
MSMFSRIATISFLFATLASSIVACSSNDDDGPGQPTPKPDSGTDAGSDSGDQKPDGSGGGNPREKIVKACTDYTDVFGKAYARCGGNYQEFYDLFMAKLGGPGCPKVVGIRNETELRGQCFPSLGTVSCSDLLSDPPRIDASCQGQLLVNQRLMQGSLAPQDATEGLVMPSLERLIEER